jgi:hypothetical protein
MTGETGTQLRESPRRPLKTRGRAWAKALARSLSRAGLAPNLISLTSRTFGRELMKAASDLRRIAVSMIFVSLLAACLLAVGCSTSPSPQPAVTPPPSRPAPSLATDRSFRRDLSQDEAAGGHTLKKHVGRTDDQLRQRLQHERNISAASTYTDRAAAELAVGSAFLQQRDRIERWEHGGGGHPNLVLDYDGAAPLGRTMRRGDAASRPCSHALVVLKWVSSSEYYVLTSYPECR